MKNSPERLAWIVLLSSFFTCVTLAVMTPLGVRWYIRNAQATQQVSLQVQRGPLSMVRGGQGRPVSVAEDSDSVLEGSRITAPNSASGSVLIQPPESKGTAPIVTVQLYDETEIVLSSARSPRFDTSPLPHQIALEMVGGRIRINVFGESSRPTTVEVRTSYGLVRLKEGSYEVKINSLTESTVRYGEAEVTNRAGEALLLGPGERALMGTTAIDGPLTAARNLVENGNFEEPLDVGWESYSEQADSKQPPGEVDVAVASFGNEERRVVEFYRDAVNHAEVGIRQDIGYDVRDFSSLELHMAVRIVSEDILGHGGCGTQGSECPIIVRLDYKDIHGND
ncbi:MAG: hypothetical protein KGY78_05250, partial [Anaerolineae bacterium]|nr:hypothetical protein [Anaerolineae bacterium]